MTTPVVDLDQGWRTERLDLEPLTAEHAAELAPVLDDAALHEFIGGAPLPAAALARRYQSTLLVTAADRNWPVSVNAYLNELSADGNRLFLIPKGCAHGFLTLVDDSDILYYMGDAFVAGAGQGVRWNDPAFEIPWPAAPRLISERDAAYPDFDIAGR